jgi:RND superfamily putative drug exporter
MQTWMLRLDGFLRRRRRVVLGAWIAVLLAAAPFAVRQAEDLSSGGFRVPGSQSTAVTEALARFPGAQRAELAAVLVPAPGATSANLRAAIDRVDHAVGSGIDLPPAARQRALRQAADGGTIVVPLRAHVDEDAAIDLVEDLRKDLSVGDGPQKGVTTHLVGQSALWAALQDLSKQDLAKAESAGFPIVLVILLAVFGSFAAAALPLAVGFFSVFITGSLIFALSQAMEMSIYVTNMASMIGIGVAVDYSLFVLARYREEVRAGRPPQQARATAMATSGLAVLFSGLTVIVSLGGLFLVQNTAIRSMALGAILVVAVSLLASASLLPVLIRLLGHRAYVDSPPFAFLRRMFTSRARRRPGSTRPGYVRRGFWQRWTETVTRRPLLSVIGASAVLLALAAPALGLKTGTGALRQLPGDHEARAGYAAAAKVEGPGAVAPVQVVAPRASASEIRATLQADPEIARIAPPTVSRDGRSVLLVAQPRSDGESAAAKAMIERLRRTLPPAAHVGGVTAAQEDLTGLITGSMWKIALFLLGLSYLVLLVLLRSVVLPLKAVLMNLLSVGAAYGVLAIVFGTVATLTLPLVLAVVFGLSMDYEVFLLSRIRERYAATGDTTSAVAEGLAASARTITSAAVIMVAVFAIFVSVGVPSIQHIGLGCAVAIALDATIVRLVLVPAAMKLLGRWNWYLPRPLDRVLPRADFEALAPRPVTSGA